VINFYKKVVLVILFIASPLLSRSQDIPYHNNFFGLNIGAVVAFGTHFQRVGVVVNAYYVYDFAQVNAETRLYFNFKNLGPQKVYTEAVTSIGAVLACGQKQQFYNPFFSSVSNQTGYKYSLAYSFNAYWNKIKTTQQTGLIAFQFDKISLITENDIFAREILDRYRTGAVLLQYQYDSLFQVGINCTMWTGQMGGRLPITIPQIAPQCYMDTIGGTYTNLSHGLLSAQFKWNVGYSQIVQANIGVDAEQVRDVLQNKMIHDMKFIPKKWRKNINCHIPMLDDKSEPYLYKEGQKIKPAKAYLNLFGNAGVFY
jgi:hypothetical protein